MRASLFTPRRLYHRSIIFSPLQVNVARTAGILPNENVIANAKKKSLTENAALTEADNAQTSFDNSRYHWKTEFDNYFITQFSNDLQNKTLI